MIAQTNISKLDHFYLTTNIFLNIMTQLSQSNKFCQYFPLLFLFHPCLVDFSLPKISVKNDCTSLCQTISISQQKICIHNDPAQPKFEPSYPIFSLSTICQFSCFKVCPGWGSTLRSSSLLSLALPQSYKRSPIEQRHFKKHKQLFEYQHLLSLRDIWGQCYKTIPW